MNSSFLGCAESATHSTVELRTFFLFHEENLYNGLRPIPEKEMPKWVRVGAQARNAEEMGRASPLRFADDHLERRQSSRSSSVNSGEQSPRRPGDFESFRDPELLRHHLPSRSQDHRDHGAFSSFRNPTSDIGHLTSYIQHPVQKQGRPVPNQRLGRRRGQAECLNELQRTNHFVRRT